MSKWDLNSTSNFRVIKMQTLNGNGNQKLILSIAALIRKSKHFIKKIKHKLKTIAKAKSYTFI